MSVSIIRLTFAELEDEPGYPRLVTEYAAEGAIPGMPPPCFDPTKYRKLCEDGVLHTYGFMGGLILMGFVLVLVTPLPKYSVPVAVTEAFFVGKAFRMTGAGLRLLQKAEEIARDLAGGRLLISAPHGGALAAALPRVGYTETNQIFFKQVA